MGTKNLNECGPSPFFLFGTKNMVRPSLMGSELRCQNFNLVKFRVIILRNPCYGTFFSQNFGH